MRASTRVVVRHRTLFVLALGLLAVALATSVIDDPLIRRIGTDLFISLVLVLGLQLFIGNSGILSFAHIGFMGIGAYASAILTMGPDAKALALPTLYAPLVGIQLPFLPAALIAAGIAALFAAVVGYPLMRLADATAVIATFALLVIVHVVLAHWSDMTNGPRTLFGLTAYTDLWTAAGAGLAVLAFVYAFKESRLGLKLRASRDSPYAAATIGIDIVKTRWAAFVVSAFIVGFGGALWAHFITSFSPSAFYLTETFVVLTMLIVGGPKTVSGAVIGTGIVTLVFEGLRRVENTLNIEQIVPFQVVGLTEVSLAIALIVILARRPGGLIVDRELFAPGDELETPAGPTAPGSPDG
ncbi:MAG: branched-chain amino acid ABC transporter permease [Chloroflexota bacterium]